MGIISINVFYKSYILDDNRLTNSERNNIINKIEKLGYELSVKTPTNFFYNKGDFAVELLNQRYFNLLIKTKKLDNELLSKIVEEYKSLIIDDFALNYLLLRIEGDIDISSVKDMKTFQEFNINLNEYNFTNKKLIILSSTIIPHKYEFELSNKNNVYLTSTKSKSEIKDLISSEKWINLYDYSYNDKVIKEIQTCNIVSIKEEENFFNKFIKYRQELTERLFVAEEIDKFQFNFKMNWWFRKQTFLSYSDMNYENEFQTFNTDFLFEILQKCTEYNCKIKK